MTKNIECQKIDHLIYLTEDELDNEQSSVLNDHLRNCSSCNRKREAFQEARQVILTLNTNSPLCPDIIIPKNLPAQIVRKSPINKILLVVRYTSTIAAAVLLFLFVSEQMVSVRKIAMLENRIQSTKNHSPIGFTERIALARNILSEKQFTDLAGKLKIKPMELNAKELLQFKLNPNNRILSGFLGNPALFRIKQNSNLLKRNFITYKSLLK
jgi:hypothetical protein